MRDQPSELLRRQAAAYRSYDLLFGVVTAESTRHLRQHQLGSGLDASSQRRIVRTLVRNLFRSHLSEILASVVYEYTDEARRAAPQSARATRDETIELLNDALALAPLVRAGQLHDSARSSTFFYVFQHKSAAQRRTDAWGVEFGAELAYVFGAPLVRNAQLSPWKASDYDDKDALLSQGVMTYWANFARTGDPLQSRR